MITQSLFFFCIITQQPAIQARITAAPVTNNRIENPRAGTENFWELLELHFASTIGSTSDVQKFIKAMKEVSQYIVEVSISMTNVFMYLSMFVFRSMRCCLIKLT